MTSLMHKLGIKTAAEALILPYFSRVTKNRNSMIYKQIFPGNGLIILILVVLLI